MTALHPSPGHTGGPSADRLGDLLVAEGLITQAQLKAALAEQKTSHQRLGYILVGNPAAPCAQVRAQQPERAPHATEGQ